MSGKRIVLGIVWIVFILGWVGTVWAGEQWEANSQWSAQNHHTRGLEEFAALVYGRTGGEMEILVHADGGLGFNDSELLQAVRDGQIPLSDMLVSRIAGDEPLFDLVTVPFLVQGFEEGRILTDTARSYFDTAATERWNQKILYIAPWPAAGLWTRDPVTDIDDMRSLRTRTYDENGLHFMESLGAEAFLLPAGEVGPALAEGLIDSVLTSTPTAVENRYWDALRYFLRIEVTMAVNMVTVNLEAFSRLSPDLQQVLIETGREMENRLWGLVAQLDRDQEKVANEHGIQSLPVSEELLAELRSLTEDIRSDWLASAPIEAREIYDRFIEAVGRH